MSDVFSHPAATPRASSERGDLRASVTVPAGPEHAWAGLTEHLHLWWPAQQLSKWGESSFFDLEGNALVETSAEDDENVWGEVVGGHPGEILELTWRHVGSASVTQVILELSAVAPAPQGHGGAEEIGRGEGAHERTVAHEANDLTGSTLTVTHRGWTTEDLQEVYDFYAEFWPLALARYQRFMGGV